MQKHSLIWLVAVLATAAGIRAAEPDLILHHGRIVTVDPNPGGGKKGRIELFGGPVS